MTLRDLRFSPGLAWSRAVGKVARWPLPAPVLRRVISGYTRLLKVELTEAARPSEGWRTFGEFFVRELRPEARAIDADPATLIAPCDGLVEAVGELSGARFRVKGRDYTVGELTGRPGWWDEPGVRGGYIVIYLSPADYHRVHSPAGSVIRAVWQVRGSCFPVNRLGQAIAPWAVVRNERVLFDLETERGPVTVAMVGALGVRAIGISVPVEALVGNGTRIDRADELGAFNLGSTVVLLWGGEGEPVVRVGQRVRLGQRVIVR